MQRAQLLAADEHKTWYPAETIDKSSRRSDVQRVPLLATPAYFIVHELAAGVEECRRLLRFYNKRGTCEQWIKEGKGAIKWTRLSCLSFNANAVRLQLHALAYNLGNFFRTLATPEAIAEWSPTTLRDKLIKIGAKVVSHGRYVTFQMDYAGHRAHEACRSISGTGAVLERSAFRN